MIISASRRTDIPAYFSEWFLNRIKEEYVMVRNPMNHQQVSRVSLSPKVIDAIVFWTKNPLPMIDKLSLLQRYTYYFQFTLNSYGEDIEPNIPSYEQRVYEFQHLADMIGSDRLIWRYDPIFLSKKYNVEFHIRSFEATAKSLANYTKQCTISFLDFCNNVQKEQLYLPTESEQLLLAESFAKIASRYGITICTCAEKLCLEQFGVKKACCIDKDLLEKLLGCSLKVNKDKGQRAECGCVSSIDIGVYNTCQNGCRYCYANYNNQQTIYSIRRHNPKSPFLIGDLEPHDNVIERKMDSLKNPQMSLF